MLCFKGPVFNRHDVPARRALVRSPWSVEIFHTLYFIIQTFPGPWSQTPTPAVLASGFLLLRSSFLILASRLFTLASHFFLASARSMAASATGAISA
jgi:hypothetical protein